MSVYKLIYNFGNSKLNGKMQKISVRDRILETASTLFYNQGYNLTGVNQIIAEAGVAKASLFQHFPTKEDLCASYLSKKNRLWAASLTNFTNKKKHGFEKALAAFDYLVENSPKENFRGCSFLNILSEVPADNDKILEEVRNNKIKLRAFFKSWLKEHPNKLLPDMAFVLFEGAIIESQVQRKIWPIETAKKALKELMG